MSLKYILAGVGLVFFGAFYLLLSNIADLKNQVNNLETAIHLLEIKDAPLTPAVKDDGQQSVSPAPQATSTKITASDSVVIPTAIIFNVLSDPSLQPQVKIPVAVESVSKSAEGDVTVSFKVFTNETDSYSAVEPRDFFEIVNLAENNERPVQVNGNFKSMPPRSIATGSAIFKIKPDKKTLILQIRMDDGNVRNYEFDFTKKSYKEAILG